MVRTIGGMRGGGEQRQHLEKAPGWLHPKVRIATGMPYRYKGIEAQDTAPCSCMSDQSRKWGPLQLGPEMASARAKTHYGRAYNLGSRVYVQGWNGQSLRTKFCVIDLLCKGIIECSVRYIVVANRFVGREHCTITAYPPNSRAASCYLLHRPTSGLNC